MSYIFHRNLQNEYPKAVRGEGVYLIDQQGKKYLDASCGAAVSCLGHHNQYVIDAVKSQLDKLPYAHTGFFTTEVAEQLATLLVERTNQALNKVYFLSGGSEAIETALKMARQYFVEIGQPQRQYFISRRQSYHGNTITALSVGGHFGRRQVYQPILNRSHHISPCYAYRGRNENETEQEYGLRVANELEQSIEELGANQVIAFIAETIVGSTVGAVVAVPGYFSRIREICDRYGVLLIMDEIMCGMGRTGQTFAFQDEGVTPDLVSIGKGLGGGYQAIAATLATHNIFDAINAGSGNFQHGHTYIGHPSSAAAALATQRYIDKNNLLENVRVRGAQLSEALNQRFAEHPHVGDIRGRGLFLGIELVKDRIEKTPFPADSKLDLIIKQIGMDNGIIVYPDAGTIDGKRGHHILLAPPFIIESSHIEEIVDKLDTTLNSAIEHISD
ncbi:aspartate aminotransferase family protein [Candidatus Spongiihabitans sp.]|uniref:aspartate aminotransferase family protein n=1 Tax=Candidatus Spongiihabitans sp. TaxID=3101308 RepID=UPI003C6F6514